MQPEAPAAIGRAPIAISWFAAAATTFAILALEIFIHRLDLRGDVSARSMTHNARGLAPVASGAVLFLGGWALNVGSLWLTPVATNVSLLRRLTAGASLLIATYVAYVGGVSAARVAAFDPCVHLAAGFLVVRTAARAASASMTIALTLAFLALTSVSIVSGQHQWSELFAAVFVGWVAYRVTLSRTLAFLDTPHPWASVKKELANLGNVYVRSRLAAWNSMYRSGAWAFLDERPQRPRSYAIAGIVQDRFPEGADVLDVGCGPGALYPLLASSCATYTGIDLAEQAIGECHRKYCVGERCAFEVAAFEDFEATRRYDVIVFNEGLYYFPLRDVDAMVRRALRLLKPQRRAVLVISTGRTIKGRYIRWKMRRRLHCDESVRVVNNFSGSHWTVDVYSRDARIIPGSRRTRPGRKWRRKSQGLHRSASSDCAIAREGISAQCHSVDVSSTALVAPQKERLVTGVALAALLTMGFYATDHHMAGEAARGRIFWRPVTALDDVIPFAPRWVWIYFMYFPLCFLPLAFRPLWNDLSSFRRVAMGFAVQFSVAIGIFWLAPSQILRPELQISTMSERALAWFYELDPGFNVFPSLHVANAAYAGCLATRFAGRRVGLIVWLGVGLIAASTVLVKQHYLVDIPAGLLLGAGSYFLVFRMMTPRGVAMSRGDVSA